MSVTPTIDQFTLVLQPVSLNFDFEDWERWKADDLINTFLIKSKLATLFKEFGQLEYANGGILKNYTHGYTFDNLPFYFRIAFHPSYIKMGISVYFSAYSWAEYQKLYEEKFQESIQLNKFFQLIESDDYTYRLSRIDIAIDFKNEGIDVAKIYRSLKSGRTEMRYRHE